MLISKRLDIILNVNFSLIIYNSLTTAYRDIVTDISPMFSLIKGAYEIFRLLSNFRLNFLVLLLRMKNNLHKLAYNRIKVRIYLPFY